MTSFGYAVLTEPEPISPVLQTFVLGVFSQRWKSHTSPYTLSILLQMNMNENKPDHSSDLIISA